MGAANALTYSATHVDPNGPGGMVAGLMILSGVHGGTMQWSEACAGRDLLQAEIGTQTCGYGFFGDCNCPRISTNDPVNCPGSPLNHPAAFQRSGAVFTSLCPPFVPQPGMSTVENLLHVPCWGVLDPGDRISNDEMAVLDATMQGLQGGLGHPMWTYVQNGSGSCSHCWDLLSDTLDVIGSFAPFSLQLPTSARVLAPVDGWYFHFDVARANPLLPGVFRYAVSTAQNRLTLSEIDNTSALTVRTAGSITPHGVDSGLDPGVPLTVRFPAPLAAGISIFLEGYAQAPAQVTRATFFGGRYALLEFMTPGVDWFWSGGTRQLDQGATSTTVAWTVTP
jgi:hypothetical protein